MVCDTETTKILGGNFYNIILLFYSFPLAVSFTYSLLWFKNSGNKLFISLKPHYSILSSIMKPEPSYSTLSESKWLLCSETPHQIYYPLTGLSVTGSFTSLCCGSTVLMLKHLCIGSQWPTNILQFEYAKEKPQNPSFPLNWKKEILDLEENVHWGCYVWSIIVANGLLWLFFFFFTNIAISWSYRHRKKHSACSFYFRHWLGM